MTFFALGPGDGEVWMGKSNKSNLCPLCHTRVNNWSVASGKTTEIAGDVVHNTCIQIYEEETGLKFADVYKATKAS